MCKLCATKEYDWGNADICCELKGWNPKTRQQRCESIVDFFLYETHTDEHLCELCFKCREDDPGMAAPDPRLVPKQIPAGNECEYCWEQPATVVTFRTVKKRACEDCLSEYIPNWKKQIVNE